MSGDTPALSPATVVVHAGRPPHLPDQPLNVPITMASTYVGGGDLEYGRYANPTWTGFEEALGALEGGRALAFSSGLAAVSTVLDLVGHGAKVVAPRHAYLGSVGQLGDLEGRGRLTAELVDISDTDAVIAALDDDVALLWIESPTNPALEVADVERLVKSGQELGASVVVDNTFATPLLQRPLELGADIVLHSVTKFLAGHSDVVMGALVVRDDQLYDVLKARRDLVGAIPGTLEAWLALRGLRTLHLRVERAQANAAELARRLGSHPAVAEVRYPGFGAVISAVLPTAEAADLLTHSTTLWVHATSLGSVESTFERRRRWKGEAATIPEGLVRMSVGIEDVEDLWNDLEQALAAIAG
jgi:cystathionine gamma-synthase